MHVWLLSVASLNFEQFELCMFYHLSSYQGWQQNTQADQEEAIYLDCDWGADMNSADISRLYTIGSYAYDVSTYVFLVSLLKRHGW